MDVTIDGVSYPMQGSGTGVWTYTMHNPSDTSIEYSFDLAWSYRNLLIFTSSDSRRYPASGHYTGNLIPMSDYCSQDAWCKEEVGTTKHFTGIWGSGPSDIFAVANASTILHYDGNNWQTSGTSNSQIQNTRLNDVWGAGPSIDNNVLALVNWYSAILRGPVNWIVQHSGSGPNTDDELSFNLNAIWGSASTDIFVVGS